MEICGLHICMSQQYCVPFVEIYWARKLAQFELMYLSRRSLLLAELPSRIFFWHFKRRNCRQTQYFACTKFRYRLRHWLKST